MVGRKGEFGYPEAFGWSFLALGGLLLSAHGLAALRPAASADLVSLGILSAAVYLLFSALLIGVYGPRALPEPRASSEPRSSTRPLRGDGQLLRVLGLRPTHPLLAVLGLGLGVAAQIPADSVRQLVELWTPMSEEETLRRAALLTSETPLEAVMMAVVAACLVPVAEEVFFRGALFGALTRSGRQGVGAALVTSIAFTISHADPRLWAPIGVVAAMAGYLRLVSGSLFPCLALHVGFNSVTVVGAASGWIRPYEDIQTPISVVIGGWLFAAALLVTVGWLAHGSERAAHSRSEDSNDR